MRIPVLFGGGTAADVYLVETGWPAPAGAHAQSFSPGQIAGHAFGCACCAPRGAAAVALAALFRARATGDAPLFSRVVVAASPAGEAAVRRAMQDVLIRTRFRI